MSTRQPKNVIFFFCDQLRYDALGYAGHSIVKTPNLDKLAEQSINFPNTFCASPVCVPARISLFTGQWAHKQGQMNNCTPIRKGQRMVTEVFKERKYHTAAIGKLHFFPLEETKRFDTVLLHDGYGNESAYIQYLNSIDPKLAKFERHAYPEEGKENVILGKDIYDEKYIESIIYGTSSIPAEYFYTNWISDEATKFLNSPPDIPFFLFVSFVGPHSPFILPQPYNTLYDPEKIPIPKNFKEDFNKKTRSQQRSRKLLGMERVTEKQLREITALYYAHITLIDEHIGRILDKVNIEDTLIIFSADHGELLGNHGLFYKNYMYDESLRIPLLIHEPSQKRSADINTLISQIDIMPTVLDLLNIDIPEWVQGNSMKKLIRGEVSEHRDHIYAEITGSGKDNNPYLLGYRTKEWLFTYEVYKGKFKDDGELYNLKEDPEQTCNLFSNPKYAPLVQENKDRLFHWLLHTQ